MIDVCVIGSGVAGMTAAIYLKRANLNVLVIEKKAPGGQVNNTAVIENYPGFESITGPELASNIFMQMNKLNISFKMMDVKQIKDKGNKKIIIGDNEEIICKKIIIATGRHPRSLGIPNEYSLTGKGISWCAICDGALYKDKEVLVIGGGNCALEESIYLASLAKKVILIHRKDCFRGDRTLAEQVKNNKKIEIKWNTIAEKFNEEDGILSSVTVKDIKNKTKEDIEVDGSFIFIGYVPASNNFKDLGITDKRGYIKVNKNMETSIKGIYACGDIIKKDLYQIATAVGEGALAASKAIKDIEENI